MLSYRNLHDRYVTLRLYTYMRFWIDESAYGHSI